jgi:hypothetical protein
LKAKQGFAGINAIEILIVFQELQGFKRKSILLIRHRRTFPKQAVTELSLHGSCAKYSQKNYKVSHAVREFNRSHLKSSFGQFI